MAKIYETKEDFQRDKLAQQAGALRLEAEKRASSSLSWVGFGFLASLFHERKPDTRGWLSYVSSITFVMGIIDMVRSWRTGSKAHDLELQHDRMGPGTIVLPPDVPVPHQEACTPCALKARAAAIGQKSHLEHAGVNAPEQTIDR